MIKYVYTLVVLLFSSLLYGCKNASCDFPPSRFIGLYGMYNGHKNGQIPTENETKFSGVWKNKDGSLIGRYREGVPSGEWLSYYSNKRIKAACTYYKNGTYLLNCWYPDGTMYLKSRGTYEFSKNEVIHKLQQSEYWNGLGEKISADDGNIASVFYAQQTVPSFPPAMKVADPEFKVECFCTFRGNTFNMSLYLWRIDDPLSPMQQIFVSGTIGTNNAINLNKEITLGDEYFSLSKYFVEDKELMFIFSQSERVKTDKNITITFYLK